MNRGVAIASVVAGWTFACGGMLPPSDAGSDSGTDVVADVQDADETGPDAGNVSMVAAGANYSCAVNAGAVTCWGQDTLGIFGGGKIVLPPANIAGLPTANSVAPSILGTGFAQTCALAVGGGLFCWGDNTEGQVGNGVVSASPVTAPTKVLPGNVNVASGNSYTCAVDSVSGIVSCWGEYGPQLGLGTSDGGVFQVPSPTQVPGLPPAQAIAAGDQDTCAIAGGDVWCWGLNLYGEVGDGTTKPRYSPVRVQGLPPGASAVSVGAEYVCAVAAGHVYCWGWGAGGQLGNGLTTNSTIPAVATGITNAIYVSAAYTHTCAITSDMAAYCWGHNGSGQLGDGTFDDHPIPTLIKSIPSVVEISAGYSHTCALTAAHHIMCWGDNTWGEIGNGVFPDGGTQSVPVPTQVVGL